MEFTAFCAHGSAKEGRDETSTQPGKSIEQNMKTSLRRWFLVLFLVSLWNLPSDNSVSAQTGTHVVINEVESGDSYSDWVELYNPTDSRVSISGSISAEGGATKVEATLYIDLEPKGRCIVLDVDYEAKARAEDALYYDLSETCSAIDFHDRASAKWLDETDEIVVLRDSASREIDRTPPLSDSYGDDRTWQRIPDGKDTDTLADWQFTWETRYAPNGEASIRTYQVEGLDLCVSNDPMAVFCGSAQFRVSMSYSAPSMAAQGDLVPVSVKIRYLEDYVNHGPLKLADVTVALRSQANSTTNLTWW